MEETVGKHGNTLFVRNLPYSATNDTLESVYSEVGPVKRCFIVKEKETQKSRGFGYVTFSLREDAEKAKNEIKVFDGRKILVHYADRKIKEKKGKKKAEEAKADNSDSDTDTEGPKVAEGLPPKQASQKQSPQKQTPTKQTPATVKPTPKRTRPSCVVVISNLAEDTVKTDLEEVVKGLRNHTTLTYPVPDRDAKTAFVTFKSKRDSSRATRKLATIKIKDKQVKAILLSQDATTKPQGYLKRCKLIIRNLSFKCDEEALKKSFSQYGEIIEVKIPTKPNGKKYGFGFVQFTLISDANKALTSMNMKEILGRKVAVDWAVPKDMYLSSTEKKDDAQSDAESTSSDDSGSYSNESEDAKSDSSDEEEEETPKKVVKEKKVVEDSESDSDSDEENEERESERESEEEESEASSDSSDDAEDTSKPKKRKHSESDSESDSDIDSGSDSDMGSTDSDSDDEGKTDVKRRKVAEKSDVSEGKTLFVRNVSFDTEEEDLQEAFAKIGELRYCRIVVDPKTEHSKGTAFIQFKKTEDVEKCINMAEDESKGGFVVDGRRLNVVKAVERGQAQKLVESRKEKVVNDGRNIYLAREGLIRPGTETAAGLSKEDLAKRAKIEQVKRQKLKNPQIFVSMTRLCLHNLPTSVDDRALRKVMLDAVGDKAAKITECRIMRDLKRMNAKGVAKSMGYAFVNFTEHRHALAALRKMNNSTEIYGEKKRPIVEFSLENKAALAAKEKRLERAKAKEAVFKGKSATYGNVRTPKKKETKGVAASAQGQEGAGEGVPRPKKGANALPSHWGPKIRHKLRPGQIKTANKPKDKHTRKEALGIKQKKAMDNQPMAAVSTSLKAPKKKGNKSKRHQPDSIDHLVNKYRQQFSSSSFGQKLANKKTKWFS